MSAATDSGGYREGAGRGHAPPPRSPRANFAIQKSVQCWKHDFKNT